LLELTNEDSISGMVAQRYNKLSYFTILIIVATAAFTSSFILSNGIAQKQRYPETKEWTIVLASLSPLLSTLILIFPLLISKDIMDLGFAPIGVQIDADNKYPMRFFSSLNKGWHKALHYIAIFSGVITGYITIIYNLNTIQYSRTFTFELIITICGIFCLFSFLLPGFCKIENFTQAQKRLVLFFEFAGLFAYMISLIFISFQTDILV